MKTVWCGSLCVGIATLFCLSKVCLVIGQGSPGMPPPASPMGTPPKPPGAAGAMPPPQGGGMPPQGGGMPPPANPQMQGNMMRPGMYSGQDMDDVDSMEGMRGNPGMYGGGYGQNPYGQNPYGG
ncbi:basic salivary proline-rich protein 3-like [Diaphorina citri]|uniref:Basic salivary proline-rich protein 3-like n=1 Tax=Diaphorina citri TaxID=121845 RepID=A0A1S3DA62_DIACI|nr:basic salivary proline-rich protein 3-like [Diaphorina citri]